MRMAGNALSARDNTPRLRVCDTKRISAHRVFAAHAGRAKPSMGLPTLIKSVIKELKTQTRVEHSRHRSFANFQVNVISELIADQLLETNPSVNLSELQEINDLLVLF